MTECKPLVDLLHESIAVIKAPRSWHWFGDTGQQHGATRLLLAGYEREQTAGETISCLILSSDSAVRLVNLTVGFADFLVGFVNLTVRFANLTVGFVRSTLAQLFSIVLREA